MAASRDYACNAHCSASNQLDIRSVTYIRRLAERSFNVLTGNDSATHTPASETCLFETPTPPFYEVQRYG